MNDKPVDKGREAWAGFGLAGYLSALQLPKVLPENYLYLLIAICILAIFSGVQRTIMKYMQLKYSRMSNPELTDLVNVICDSKEARNEPDQLQEGINKNAE